MVVGTDLTWLDQAATATAGYRAQVVGARDLETAIRAMRAAPIDLLIVDGEADAPLGWIERLRHHDPHLESIAVLATASFHRAHAVLRAGVQDMVMGHDDAHVWRRAVRSALDRRTMAVRRMGREQRLVKLCRRQRDARRRQTQHFESMCRELVGGYEAVVTTLDQVRAVKHFERTLQHESALGPMLKSVMDFVLERLGPANAALFVPAPGGGFNVGAYVHPDFERDSAKALFDHLGAVMAPRITHAARLNSNTAIEDVIGADDGVYLADTDVVAVPCRHGHETLAVLMAFRDTSRPFDGNAVDLFAGLAPCVAHHLARLVDAHASQRGRSRRIGRLPSDY